MADTVEPNMSTWRWASLSVLVGVAMIILAWSGRAESDVGDAQLVALHNDRAGAQDDCPDVGASWHFVIAPNNDAHWFRTISLVLDGSLFTFSASEIINNGRQADNVFVAVPDGYELNDLQAGGSFAEITPGTGKIKFVLSGVCRGSSTPSSTSTVPTSTTSTSPTSTSVPATSTTSTTSTPTSTSTSTSVPTSSTTSTSTSTSVPASSTTTTSTSVPTSSTTTTTTAESGTPTTTVPDSTTTTTVEQRPPATPTTAATTTTTATSTTTTTTVAKPTTTSPTSTATTGSGSTRMLMLVGSLLVMVGAATLLGAKLREWDE